MHLLFPVILIVLLLLGEFVFVFLFLCLLAFPVLSQLLFTTIRLNIASRVTQKNEWIVTPLVNCTKLYGALITFTMFGVLGVSQHLATMTHQLTDFTDIVSYMWIDGNVRTALLVFAKVAVIAYSSTIVYAITGKQLEHWLGTHAKLQLAMTLLVTGGFGFSLTLLIFW